MRAALGYGLWRCCTSLACRCRWLAKVVALLWHGFGKHRFLAPAAGSP